MIRKNGSALLAPLLIACATGLVAFTSAHVIARVTGRVAESRHRTHR